MSNSRAGGMPATGRMRLSDAADQDIRIAFIGLAQRMSGGVRAEVAVLAAGCEIHLFPLDVTTKASVTPSSIAAFAAMGTRCGDAAHTMLRSFDQRETLLHDACPVAWLIAPTLFAGERCSMSVDWRPGPTEGHSQAWPMAHESRPGPPNVIVYTDVDQPRLLALLHERIARLP